MIYQKDIQIPIFKGRFLICFVDKETYIRDIDNYDDIGNDYKIEYAHHFLINLVENNKKYRGYTVAFNLGYDKDYAEITHGVIAHEIFHAAYSILDDSDNIKLSEKSEGVYSYLIEWLTDETYKFIKEQKIDIS